MIHFIWTSSIVAKSIMILLIALSIWSCALICQKFFEFWPLHREWKVLQKATNPVYTIFRSISVNRSHLSYFEDLALILSREYQEKRIHLMSFNEQYTFLLKIAQHSILKRSSQLLAHISFFATVGNVCPFIGLLGTVIGIINTFTSISVMQQISLNVIAPGIAVALVATALGLAAAIPASVAYNRYINWIHEYTDFLELFSQECILILIKQKDIRK